MACTGGCSGASPQHTSVINDVKPSFVQQQTVRMSQTLNTPKMPPVNKHVSGSKSLPTRKNYLF